MMELTTPSLLFLALGLCIGCLGGIAWGVRRGVEKENLRVHHIFEETLHVVYGGAIKTVWDRVNRHITREEMLDRLRESFERRNRDKKRLRSYEAQYGRGSHRS